MGVPETFGGIVDCGSAASHVGDQTVALVARCTLKSSHPCGSPPSGDSRGSCHHMSAGVMSVPCLSDE